MDPPTPPGSASPLACDACSFDWGLGTGAAIELVRRCPEEYAEDFRLAASGLPRSDRASWSASEYLWHVVDVLRLNTERLWILALSPSAGVTMWDADELAAVRRYPELPTAAGIVALRSAAEVWTRAAQEAPERAITQHPEWGTISRHTVVLRVAHEVDHHRRDIRDQRGLP